MADNWRKRVELRRSLARLLRKCAMRLDGQATSISHHRRSPAEIRSLIADIDRELARGATVANL